MCSFSKKKVHHIKVFIKNDFWPKKHYSSKVEKKLCSFLKKDWTSKINAKILMIIMKEKKAKRHLPSLSTYCFKKYLKKRRKIEGSRCGSYVGNSFFFASLPSSFLHWRKDVKKTTIVFRPPSCNNLHFFPQSFSFFLSFPNTCLKLSWFINFFTIIRGSRIQSKIVWRSSADSNVGEVSSKLK